MNDINHVVLIGRLTKDVECKSVGNGMVSNFTLAVNESYKKDGEKIDKASFIPCVVWGKGSEILSKYASKGSKIAIEGKVKQRSYEKDGQKHSIIEISVEEFQMLDGKKSDGKTDPDGNVGGAFNDESVPF